LIVALTVWLRPIVISPFNGSAKLFLTIVISTALWTVTPYLLLGRRLSWRRLIPTASLTAFGMAGVAVWSVIWMPHTLASSAAQFGVIGVGFAMLTWFVVASVVVVVSTTGGAAIAERWLKR
jgi:membrane protein